MRKIVPVIATIALTGMLVSCGAKAPVEQIPLTPKAQSVDTKAPETKAVSDTMLAPTPVDVAATGMMPSDGAYVNTSGTTVDMAGGVNINSNGSNVSVTSTGAIVNSDGTSVTANSDGSYINSDGTTVDTKE